jgi:hypothetical protein
VVSWTQLALIQYDWYLPSPTKLTNDDFIPEKEAKGRSQPYENPLDCVPSSPVLALNLIFELSEPEWRTGERHKLTVQYDGGNKPHSRSTNTNHKPRLTQDPEVICAECPTRRLAPASTVTNVLRIPPE